MRLIDSVKAGDTVTILTPQGQERKGRAVMPCIAGGWVLNGGGRHGTPIIADDSNTIRVRRSHKRMTGYGITSTGRIARV